MALYIFPGGIDIKRVVIVLLISLALSAITAAESAKETNLTYKEEKSLIFEIDQKVSGTGYFTAYKNMLMPDVLGIPGFSNNGVEAKGRGHGSGTIDADFQIYAESSYINESYVSVEYDEDGEPYEELEESSSIIEIEEDSKRTYSRESMEIGSHYYSHHPVVFNSLLKDSICLKNRGGLNSMDHSIEYAHGLERVLDAESDLINSTLNVEEELIDGKAHFGVLQLAEIPVEEDEDNGDEDEDNGDEDEDNGDEDEDNGDEDEDNEDGAEETDPEEDGALSMEMNAWKMPLIVIDEDYIGSFSIKKRMTLYSDWWLEEKEEEDMPCCHGGFEDINPADRRSWQVEGVFDCTCYKVPDRRKTLG